MICDIANANATGSFQLDRAVAENADALVRSYRNESAGNPTGSWCELLFQFEPKTFIHANDQRIVGYAPTPGEAERQVREFQAKYWIEKLGGGSFQLINTSRFRDSDSENVSLEPATILSDEKVDLHYGEGFAEWHHDFCQKIQDAKYGLSIFKGPPGTGKTFFLRHLAVALKESHRFYFLPPVRMSILSDPEFLEIGRAGGAPIQTGSLSSFWRTRKPRSSRGAMITGISLVRS